MCIYIHLYLHQSLSICIKQWRFWMCNLRQIYQKRKDLNYAVAGDPHGLDVIAWDLGKSVLNVDSRAFNIRNSHTSSMQDFIGDFCDLNWACDCLGPKCFLFLFFGPSVCLTLATLFRTSWEAPLPFKSHTKWTKKEFTHIQGLKVHCMVLLDRWEWRCGSEVLPHSAHLDNQNLLCLGKAPCMF